MPKLTINRNSEWNNRMRDIGIYLDDIKIGTIGNGEVKEFDISNGTHKLQAKIDWCGSQSINLENSNNENKNIQLSGFKIPYFLIIIGLSFMSLYFTFQVFFDLRYPLLMFIAIPGLIYYAYYLSFGRNKYLRLKEVK